MVGGLICNGFLPSPKKFQPKKKGKMFIFSKIKIIRENTMDDKEGGNFLVKSVKVMCYKLKTVVER